MMKHMWYTDGGGLELMRDVFKDEYGVVLFPSTPLIAQTYWYTKDPINNVDDLLKLKVRSAGARALTADNAGISVVTLPGGEIVPAMERGVIDGCEFSDAYSDGGIGFFDVSNYLYYTERAIGGHLDFAVNGAIWDALPQDLKDAVDRASRDVADYALTRSTINNINIWKEAEAQGLEIRMLPKDVEDYMHEKNLEFYAEWSAKDPLVKKILDSMMEFGEEHAHFEQIAARGVFQIDDLVR
ncbi:TRAP transporter substrate-binding protein DctP [Candidatus Contubernalis alkaliaceticus]|uniref:TRAP transporter substrate-binding protein DctP n=1 Tax=Candidatus Contubernalis alkaliaceticus TaxID=338645 RepID=UPI001F4C087E|nr:TRAP transporter substrate-binding protein DctP [Candidatus Contubernalis alkalaceticus]UNC92934.1 TRAP transporter substrate-binding protein DctP [Candidatus Contubernalis alkalaceticus]